MTTLITILIVVTAVILILIVLVQNSKGGGLAANFSSSNQIMGVRKTTDFLEKTTWTLIAVIVVLCVAATSFYTSEVPESTSEIADKVEAPIAPAAPVATETPAPAIDVQATEAAPEKAE